MSPLPPPSRPWPILAALMAAGLAARLVNSGSGLWYDEVVTLVKYVRAPLGELLTKTTDFNNHMLFTLAAKVTVGIFGEEPWALRLPAVLLGVAGIPALWWFASRVVGRREALLCAVLLAVAYQPVWFSQNARGYTGLLLFGVLASGLFIAGMRHPTRATWGLYALAAAAGIWTHLTAGFAIAAHGIVWLWTAVAARLGRRRGAEPRYPGAVSLLPLAGFVLAAVLGLALYAGLLPDMLAAFGKQAGLASTNVKVREWTSPLWTLKEAVLRSGLGPAAAGVLGALGIVAVIGFVSLARRIPVAVAIMVLPAPIALAVLKAASFHIWPRYFFPLFGFALVFLVHGIWVLAARLPGPKTGPRVAAAAVGLLAVLSVVQLVPNWRLPKQDYAGARDFVLSERAFGEPVLTAGMASLPYSWLYAPDFTPVEDVAELERIAATAPRTWLVYSFPTVLRTSHPDVLERIARFELVREFPGTVGDGTVFVTRSR